MKKLKIALYQPWIYQRGGMERVILEMTSSESKHDWTIFTNHFDPETTFDGFKQRKVVELNRVSVRRTPKDLIEVTAAIAGQKIALAGFDAFFVSTAGFGEFITLRNHSLPTGCFCHTPLRVIHDKAARHDLLHRKMHTFPVFLAFEAAYRALEKRAWRHFKEIACNSMETRKRIVEGGLAHSNKVEIVNPGVSARSIKPSSKYLKYFLLPGRISKLKNNLLAVKAFNEFVEKTGGLGFKLVIAGGVGEKDLPYLSELESAAAGNKAIVFEKNVSEKRFAELYRECYAVLFTALNEDWGIVPVEAMAYARPVIAVNEGGPRESVLDGKTGFLVEGKPSAFAAKMTVLAKSPALVKKLGAAGRKRAVAFDWSKFVSRMDAIVEKVAFSK